MGQDETERGYRLGREERCANLPLGLTSQLLNGSAGSTGAQDEASVSALTFGHFFEISLSFVDSAT